MIRAVRDFHDARLDFTLRHRNDNLSFALRFTILCGIKHPGQAKAEEDVYLYPWLRTNDLKN